MSPLLASLLHSLWIGLVLWLGLRIVLRAPRLSAEARHGAALAAVLTLFVGWGAAWMLQRARFEPRAQSVAESVLVVNVPEPAKPEEQGVRAEEMAPVVVPPARAERGAWLGARVEALGRAAAVQGCLEIVWALGVFAGLTRLALGLRSGGGRWLVGQTLVEPPAVWLDAWRGELEACARRLRVNLVAIEAAGAPFVIGFLEPAIVVPLASCAGVSPELARAALAHELAHVARRDWLVEIVMRVVEAVLFFNPFVWLLTAQARAERESCCDMWACERTGMPRVDFAAALVAWGRRFSGGYAAPSGALALGGGGELRGRVERLLGRGRGPRARGWRGLVCALALIACGLAGYGLMLWWGAAAMRDVERVRFLEQAAAPYATSDTSVPESRKELRLERKVSGRVIDEAGNPVVGALVRMSTSNPRDENAATTDASGRFVARRAVGGAVTMRIRVAGFAMSKTTVQPDETEPAGPIVLTTGLTVPFRVVDETGRSLPGAEIRWALDHYGPEKTDLVVTDEAGLAWVKNLPVGIRVEVKAEAKGYAPAVRTPLAEWELNSATPLEMRLRPGRGARVRVVAEEDGRPVPGAKIRIGWMSPAWSPVENPHPSWNYGGLTTDKDGVVVLDHLRIENTYGISVSLPKEDEDISFRLEDAATVDREQIVVVSRKWQATVELRNFPQKYRGASVRLELEHSVMSDAGPGTSSRPRSVRIDETGAGWLTVSGRGDNGMKLVFDEPLLQPLGVALTPERIAAGPVIVDHARLPVDSGAARTRRVAIRFMNGGEEFFPAGRFYIHRLASPHFWDADGFALEAGKPLFAEWAEGTRLKLTEGWWLVGARIDMSAVRDTEIVVNEKLAEIVVPVLPAGMVRAQVKDADGRSLPDARIQGSSEHEKSSDRRRIQFLGQQTAADWKVSGPVDFSLFGTPLWAAKDLVFVRGEPVRVSKRRPVVDVTLTLPKTRSQAVRLIDSAGRSLPGIGCSVALRFGERYGDGPPTFWVEATSDENGMVRFVAGEDLLDWKDVELAVDAAAPGLARTMVLLPVGELAGAPDIRMEPAAEFVFSVINRATGRGVPGVEFVLEGGEGKARVRNAAKVSTDAQGRARFGGLVAGREFRLQCWGFTGERGLRLSESRDQKPNVWSSLTSADSGLKIYAEPES